MVDLLHKAQPSLAGFTLKSVAAKYFEMYQVTEFQLASFNTLFYVFNTFVEDVWIADGGALLIPIESDLTEEKNSRDRLEDKFLLLILHIPESEILFQLGVTVEVKGHFGVRLSDGKESELFATV